MSAQPVPVVPLAGNGVVSMLGKRARDWAPALVVLVGFFLVWEAIVKLAHVQRFLLPAPTAIWSAFSSNQGLLWHEGWVTFQEALGGFAIGCAAGIVFAVVVARWKLLGSALLPYAIAANAIPIIAFAPLLNNWFGLLNPLSKALMAAVLVFFPVMANVTRGLVQVDPGAIELMRSYAASEWTILRKVRVPNALPYFFTALKVVTTFSLIGAIVAEYFGGSNSSLGRRIVESASAFKFEITWGAILFGAMTGIVFYLVVVAIERAVIPWAAALRGDG